MKPFGIAVASMMVLIIIVVVIGYSLPVGHRATVERTVKAAPDTVFRLLTTFEAFPTWRSGLTSVEMLPSSASGQLRFRELGADGAITLVVDTMEASRRLVTRIDDPGLPFGGSWTFELAPAAAGGTSVQITEDGQVYNPLFRFVSRFVLGHDRTILRYLDDVERAFAGRPR